MGSVYTVTQVNSYIKNMFTQDFMLQSLQVKGEVSNCKYHSSGHIYFTLKDNSGTISCVMFAGHRRGLTFPLSEGMQVVVSGTVDIYERDGKYQLYAKQITKEGYGLLYERFEKLKLELEEMGMFSKEYKQPIPKYIKTLGVVTAPTGAAVRDIIQIVSRRNPYVQIILYPALVQGEGAAVSIVQGIRALEALNVDVMIVGRGGGSIEDLWAFNEEIVAQAVFDCSVPIISAVGHETDTTIIDFVSDLRAPTPSAAAELAVFEYDVFADTLDRYEQRMLVLMEQKLKNHRNKTAQFQMQLKYNSPLSRLRQRQTYAMQLEEKLQNGMKKNLEKNRYRLAIDIEKLKALSPLNMLNKGFSYVIDERGNNINSVSQVQKDEQISIIMLDGQVKALVKETEEQDDFRREF